MSSKERKTPEVPTPQGSRPLFMTRPIHLPPESTKGGAGQPIEMVRVSLSVLGQIPIKKGGISATLPTHENSVLSKGQVFLGSA